MSEVTQRGNGGVAFAILLGAAVIAGAVLASNYEAPLTPLEESQIRLAEVSARRSESQASWAPDGSVTQDLHLRNAERQWAEAERIRRE